MHPKSNHARNGFETDTWRTFDRYCLGRGQDFNSDFCRQVTNALY